MVFIPLGPEDGPILEQLYKRTPGLEDVFESVGEADAQSTYVALPENKTYQDKYLVGAWIGPELVGGADVILSFPMINEATCGLLLIDAQERGRGLGSHLLSHLEDIARCRGAERFIVVVRKLRNTHKVDTQLSDLIGRMKG